MGGFSTIWRHSIQRLLDIKNDHVSWIVRFLVENNDTDMVPQP